jgi:aryl-alcohol dehydrogenase-like predicted oxidoreductase
MFIGEWMETRGIRDQMVIATKVSFELHSVTQIHDSL